MKRAYPSKRRDRKSGQSPYARHAKAPYRYSPAYYQWFKETAGHVAKSQKEA